MCSSREWTTKISVGLRYLDAIQRTARFTVWGFDNRGGFMAMELTGWDGNEKQLVHDVLECGWHDGKV